MDQNLTGEIIKMLGNSSLMFVVWYLTAVLVNKNWERNQKSDDERREKDRIEHMAKWESMVLQQRITIDMLLKNHTEEKGLLYKLHERQTDALEMYSGLISVINQKIDTNQFCPTSRKESRN